MKWNGKSDYEKSIQYTYKKCNDNRNWKAVVVIDDILYIIIIKRWKKKSFKQTNCFWPIQNRWFYRNSSFRANHENEQKNWAHPLWTTRPSVRTCISICMRTLYAVCLFYSMTIYLTVHDINVKILPSGPICSDFQFSERFSWYMYIYLHTMENFDQIKTAPNIMYSIDKIIYKYMYRCVFHMDPKI